MYRQSKYFIKNFLFIPAFTALLMFAAQANAQVQTAASSSEPSRDVLVKYLGQENDMMVFSIQFNNESASKFNVSICNNAGEVLFRDVFHLKFFDKKFKVPKENGQLKLIISNTTGKVIRNIKIDQALPFSVARKA